MCRRDYKVFFLWFVFLNTQNFEWSLVGGSSNICLIVSGSTVGPRYVSDSGFSPAGKLPAQTSCMLGNAVQSLASWSQSALRNISVSFMIPCSWFKCLYCWRCLLNNLRASDIRLIDWLIGPNKTDSSCVVCVCVYILVLLILGEI